MKNGVAAVPRRGMAWMAGLLTAVLLWLGGMSPALAQRGWDDEGDYQILQARFGTARHHVDVSERLRDLARQDRRVRVSPELFGQDPDPGRRKSLRIYARGPDGERCIFEYAEQGFVDGARFSGWRRGDWGGRPSGWREDWQGGWGDELGGDDAPQARDEGEYRILQASYGTARRSIDVSDRLKQLARRDGRVRVGNAVFEQDPDPGQLKTLRIVARSRDGGQRLFEFREGQVLDGAQFMGWRRGDWDSAGSSLTQPTGRLIIVSARYGESGANSVDVSARLRELIWRNRLEVRVDNALAGVDPAPGRRKTLSLSYAYEGQDMRQIRVDEQEMLLLP